MHISDILKAHATSLSFEFFPPKTQDASNSLFSVISDLKAMKPAFVSVTYGAGGTTRELTHDLVVKIQNETAITVVSHLTCIGSTDDEIGKILDRYAEQGITNVMALRGDKPASDVNWIPVKGEFKHAAGLVSFIKKRHPQMGVGVAGFPEGHPECPNRLVEIEHLKAKIDAGADYICTQLFFENRDFYDFRERCLFSGINVPVIAGLMPITSLKTMNRMAELSAGSRFPARLLRALNRADTAADVKNIGVHWTAEQVRDLLDNDVKGIHFYTLNKSELTLSACRAIGVSNSSQFNKDSSRYKAIRSI
jgi:methylenetetrahydrofolate reductase (NADPH)